MVTIQPSRGAQEGRPALKQRIDVKTKGYSGVGSQLIDNLINNSSCFCRYMWSFKSSSQMNIKYNLKECVTHSPPVHPEPAECVWWDCSGGPHSYALDMLSNVQHNRLEQGQLPTFLAVCKIPFRRMKGWFPCSLMAPGDISIQQVWEAERGLLRPHPQRGAILDLVALMRWPFAFILI